MMDNRCITINYAERKLLRQPLRQPLFVVLEHYRFKEIAKYLVSHNIETTSCRRLWRFHVQDVFIICTNSVQILYKICT